MRRNKTDDNEYSILANKYGIDASEIRKIVSSFFDIVQLEARKLPFNTCTKIYSRSKFKEYDFVYMIPYIGRIGTAYSRYLCWRKNESDMIEQKLKSNYRKESDKEWIERIAEEILSGNAESCDMKRRRCDLKYKRIWMVGPDGKRMAKQVIPIKTDKR